MSDPAAYAKRASRADLLADVVRRIRDINDHDWHITAILYLGLKPEIAAEIRQWAATHGAPRRMR